MPLGNRQRVAPNDQRIEREVFMRLRGRVALVTGASRGIGRAIALGMAREGADIAVNYNKSEQHALHTVEQVSALGRRAAAFKADVTCIDEVQRMVDGVRSTFGRVDILVNNSGVLSRRSFFDLTLEEWDETHRTNLRACFAVSQIVARLMREQQNGGTIINVSSIASKNASPNLTHYCTAKAGVTMLTKQMALELAPYNIRVNEICPGLIETDLNRKDIAVPAFREARLSRIPLRKIGRPADVAGAAVFLASDEASLMTGASVFIDGGASIW